MSIATTRRMPPEKLCINCHYHDRGDCYRNYEITLSLVDGKSIIYVNKESCMSDVYQCEHERHHSSYDHVHCGIDGIFWRKREELR